MEGTLFNIFAGLAVLSALLVVANPFSRNPVTVSYTHLRAHAT